MKPLEVYITGLFVLIIAIIVNPLVSHLGILTWYDFGSSFFTNPMLALTSTKWLSLAWLFIIYPIVLGLGALLGRKCCVLFDLQ
jgi:hypothetical protein